MTEIRVRAGAAPGEAFHPLAFASAVGETMPFHVGPIVLGQARITAAAVSDDGAYVDITYQIEGDRTDAYERLQAAEAHVRDDHKILKRLWGLHQPVSSARRLCDECLSPKPCLTSRILTGEEPC
jgi:hypothetical protein